MPVINEHGQVSEIPPDDCAAGHPLRRPYTVGWLPCGCAMPQIGGHRTWRCACGVTTYEPPHDTNNLDRWTIGQ